MNYFCSHIHNKCASVSHESKGSAEGREDGVWQPQERDGSCKHQHVEEIRVIGKFKSAHFRDTICNNSVLWPDICYIIQKVPSRWRFICSSEASGDTPRLSHRQTLSREVTSEWSQHSAEVLVLVLVLCLLSVTLSSWSQVHFLFSSSQQSAEQNRTRRSALGNCCSQADQQSEDKLQSPLWALLPSDPIRTWHDSRCLDLNRLSTQN